MRLSLRLLASFFLLVSRLSWAGGDVFEALGTYTGTEKTAISVLFSEVQELLPPTVREAFNTPIQVRFERFDQKTQLEVPPCTPNPAQSSAHVLEKLGQAESGKIVLNRLLLDEIALGERESRRFSCGHRSMYRLALASLIHEVAHLYDGRSGDRISGQRTYRKLIGWLTGRSLSNGFALKAYPRNSNPHRSPDPYENTSIEEHLAVNLEYFLLDHEYVCRRPTLYHFFSRLLNFTPRLDPAAPRCRPFTKISLSTMGLSSNDLAQEIDLDPESVYEVHHLLASPGEGTESRWGHSMFRLVRCRPGRTEMNSECVKDISHHLVVSYSAHIEEVHMSLWKGLSGQYPSIVSIYSLPNVISYYTKDQLRDVQSRPLKLSREEVRLFVSKVLEHHWEYESEYKFLTNNCSTEAKYLLKSVLPGSNALRDFTAYSPIGLGEELQRRGLIEEPDPHISPAFYHFSSAHEDLMASFSTLSRYFLTAKKMGGLFPWKTFTEFLQASSLGERATLVMAASLDADRSRVRPVFSSFYALEGAILLKKENQLKANILNRLQELSEQPDLVLLQTLHTLTLEQATRHRTTRGYGIPLDSDLDPLDESTVSQQSRAAVREWIATTFSSELAEINGISKFMEQVFAKVAGQHSQTLRVWPNGSHASVQ